MSNSNWAAIIKYTKDSGVNVSMIIKVLSVVKYAEELGVEFYVEDGKLRKREDDIAAKKFSKEEYDKLSDLLGKDTLRDIFKGI